MARVAQIGVGNWGVNHKRVLNDLDVLVATCDLNGKEDYTDSAGMLSNEDIDHVVICTPPETHYDIAGFFLDQGINVFVEKPMAMNSRDCASLIDLATKNKLKLQCGYIERYNPLVKIPHQEFMLYIRENKHYAHIKTDIVNDMVVHDIDLAIREFNEMPQEVMADIHGNYSTVVLKFAYGTATIVTNWMSEKRIREINHQSTIGSEDILKAELIDFITRKAFIDYNALYVAKVVEAIIDGKNKRRN